MPSWYRKIWHLIHYDCYVFNLTRSKPTLFFLGIRQRSTLVWPAREVYSKVNNGHIFSPKKEKLLAIDGWISRRPQFGWPLGPTTRPTPCLNTIRIPLLIRKSLILEETKGTVRRLLPSSSCCFWDSKFSLELSLLRGTLTAATTHVLPL